MKNILFTSLEESGAITGSIKAPDVFISIKASFNELLRPIDLSSHKGHFGHVAILEGHANFLGASRLAALGALKAGAGLVTIIAEKPKVLGYDRCEFMKCSLDQLNPILLGKISALVIGPGLSYEEKQQKQALKLLEQASQIPNIIIDANAISLLADQELKHLSGQLILTPHYQEAARLIGRTAQDIRLEPLICLEALSQLKINQQRSVIWVIKGASTLIHQADQGTLIMPGHLPILACGGSGDLLAGAIAGLIKQTSSPLAASILATNTLQRAGRLAQLKADRGILASELAEYLPSLLRRNIG